MTDPYPIIRWAKLPKEQTRPEVFVGFMKGNDEHLQEVETL
jgi:hypothetical protein